jgi:hypothetical protein
MRSSERSDGTIERRGPTSTKLLDAVLVVLRVAVLLVWTCAFGRFAGTMTNLRSDVVSTARPHPVRPP